MEINLSATQTQSKKIAYDLEALDELQQLVQLERPVLEQASRLPPYFPSLPPHPLSLGYKKEIND